MLEYFLERYFDFPVVQKNGKLESRDDPICWIENNTLLCLFGALSCIEQGLFVQSGILLRSVLENCFVLVDLSESEEQMKRFLQDKYTVNGLLSRTKSSLPGCLVEWYGYFSRNFAHFGPMHPLPNMPLLCWPDNWVLVTGIQNIVRGCVAFGIVLERVHYDESSQLLFWKFDTKNRQLIFEEEGTIWDWIDELGKEIVARYPPNEQRKGFIYSGKKYKLK